MSARTLSFSRDRFRAKARNTSRPICFCAGNFSCCSHKMTLDNDLCCEATVLKGASAFDGSAEGQANIMVRDLQINFHSNYRRRARFFSIFFGFCGRIHEPRTTRPPGVRKTSFRSSIRTRRDLRGKVINFSSDRIPRFLINGFCSSGASARRYPKKLVSRANSVVSFAIIF